MLSVIVNVGTRAVFHDDPLVILRVRLHQSLSSPIFHLPGVRLESQVLDLGSTKLQTQQEKGDLTHSRFHPIPCPSSHLQGRLQVPGFRNIRRDVIYIEPCCRWQVKDQGNGSQACGHRYGHTNLVRQRKQKHTLSIFLSNLLYFFAGRVVRYIIGRYNVACQDFPAGFWISHFAERHQRQIVQFCMV
jgi:hypothetical protein